MEDQGEVSESDREELVRRLDAAIADYESGNFSSALEQFEHLEKISWHPQDIARIRLGQFECLFADGKIDLAVARLSSVDRSQLDEYSLLDYEFAMAKIELHQGKRAEALRRVQNVRAQPDPLADIARGKARVAAFRTLHGKLLAETGNWREAIPLLESTPDVDSGWAEARLQLGVCYMVLRSYPEALRCFMDVLEADPTRLNRMECDTATRNVGAVHFRSGSYSEAVDWLVRASAAFEAYPDQKAEVDEMLSAALGKLGRVQ